MSLYDKMRCKECGHPRYRHVGSHLKGSRTACVQQVGARHTDKCSCKQFKEPDAAE